jgi:hypothetical protein
MERLAAAEDLATLANQVNGEAFWAKEQAPGS